tara:strand:+ start:63 stop:1034 length:972 start_codon:yes stop_codon:yes gene_type:complete
VKAVAVVQARMGSTRLPGKVLMDLAGDTVVGRILQRLDACMALDDSLVATTSQPEEQPLIDHLQSRGRKVWVYAGDENDLVGRYLTAADHFDAEIIVIVCGDCPLLHPPSIDRMVEHLRTNPELDHVGFSTPSIEGGVAVVHKRALERIVREGATGNYREHSTLYIHEHSDRFKMGGVPAEPIFQDIEHRLWLDTAADLEFLRTVYRRFLPTHGIVSLPDVVCALKAEPELRALNGHVKQRDPKLTAKRVLIIHHEGIELTELGRALTERLGVSVDFVCAGETAEEAAYDCIFQLEERSDYDSVEEVNETVLRVKSALLEEDG